MLETAEAIVALDPLPDSRCSSFGTPRGAVMGPMGWMVPIFCANCGADGGQVPQENMTFVSYLCNHCYLKHGNVEGIYIEPDRIYWARVELEQREKYGRLLSNEELLAVVAADASPLATLIKEGV